MIKIILEQKTPYRHVRLIQLHGRYKLQSTKIQWVDYAGNPKWHVWNTLEDSKEISKDLVKKYKNLVAPTLTLV